MAVPPDRVAGLDEVETALGRGLPIDDVLDLVDAVIDNASGTADRAGLLHLAVLLDDAAETRTDGRGLTIAAERARAAAAAFGAAPAAAPVPAGAPTPPPPAARPVAEPAAPPPHAARPAVEPAARPPSTAGPVAAPAAPPPHVAGPVAEPTARYAGWWQRVFAFLVDWFALGIAFAVIPADASDGVWIGALLGFPMAYFAGFHAFVKGRTIGKALFGIAVRLDDGRPVDLAAAVARALVQGVLWITVIGGLVDSLAPIGDSRNRALHDRAAGTIVVRVR